MQGEELGASEGVSTLGGHTREGRALDTEAGLGAVLLARFAGKGSGAPQDSQAGPREACTGQEKTSQP